MIGLCMTPASAFASSNPNWTIDTHEFEYDMSMYVSIQKNGVAMGNPSDLTLAAFVGEECRGLANLMYVSGTPYFYLRVRSRVQQGETVSFRCYDASRGVVDSVMAKVQFENLKQFGFPSVPFVMSLFIPVTTISLDKDVLNLLVDVSDTLHATILPLDASNKEVVWSTSDSTVAQVINGVVTALGTGSATITALARDGGWSAHCRVNVAQLEKFELTIQDAESGSIGIQVEPFQKQVISIHTSVDWELYSVLMNQVEVIGEVVMNTYTTPVLTAPSTLQIITKKIVPILTARAENPIQLKAGDGMLTVKGAVAGDRIRVYNLEGRLVKSTRVTGVETILKLKPGTVHILKIGMDTFKVVI